jgi:Holliday junction resolvase-like predicted endonuclease
MERRKYTPDDVWAMLAETDRLQKDNAIQIQEIRNSQKETALQMKETDRRMEETALQMKETALQMKETDRRMQKLDDKMGGIDDNLGFHAEQFVQEALAKSKTVGGIKYDSIIRNMKCEDETEFDVVLINSDSIAIIEVKNRIHPSFVERMAKDRLDKFRKYITAYKNHKAYLGIAAFSFCNDVLEKARERGIGIIRQAGDSVEMDAGKLKTYW